MIRYKSTRIALGDDDLRYHLERLLLRHSRMAEWHRQDLDRDGYSDDSVALDSDFFSPYNLSPRGSLCSSSPESPSQNSWQSNQDKEASPSGLSSLFNEPDAPPCVVVQDEVRIMSATCSSGVGGPLSGTSSGACQEQRVTESAHQHSWNTPIDSSLPSNQSLGKRGLEWLHNHSQTRQPFATATVPTRIPVSLFSEDDGKGLSAPHRHSIPHQLLLSTREVNGETLSCNTQLADSSLLFVNTSSEVENLRQTWSRSKVQGSGLRPSLNLEIRLGSTCVSLAAQETQWVDFLARPSSRTNATLEVIKMPGENKSSRKTRGQRANLSLPGSAAIHHNGPGEGSGAAIARSPAAFPTRLQSSARPRPTEAHRSNPIPRTEPEPVGLLPEQGHEGTVTYQAVNTSLAAPAEGVQNHDLEHNPPQEHMVREAPAISGLLGNLIPMYAQGGYNVDRVKLVASMPSANPPVPGDRGRMAAPHGHRSEPCIDTRASINPHLMEARELDGYVNFMTYEVHEKDENDIKDYGSTMLGYVRQ
ncbi:hypothetical protein CBS63078_4627 [Aspergillus niger]|nr:hypothetical protein CBS115989_2905 [Aspergillus niger]KAI2824425.1 hypothetical protein CBS133816_8839 [Aspergillus niger]KAI2847251.1 hypothetical protein CBS11350_3260 [Aspergillus niger]KAI2850157.1 hypothetical protein CBS12448_8749 [Aspergillus niger]KAI2856979.1 hypothetical protein CBS11232_3414 [Aspergillus niger]